MRHSLVLKLSIHHCCGSTLPLSCGQLDTVRCNANVQSHNLWTQKGQEGNRKLKLTPYSILLNSVSCLYPIWVGTHLKVSNQNAAQFHETSLLEDPFIASAPRSYRTAVQCPDLGWWGWLWFNHQSADLCSVFTAALPLQISCQKQCNIFRFGNIKTSNHAHCLDIG